MNNIKYRYPGSTQPSIAPVKFTDSSIQMVNKDSVRYITIPTKFNIGLIGVFKNPNSSNIRFSEHFKKSDEIKNVYELDYRETMKYHPREMLYCMEELCSKSDIILIMKGGNIPTEHVISISKKKPIFLWFMDPTTTLKCHNNIIDFSRYCSWRSATGYDISVTWSKFIDLPVTQILDGTEPTEYYNMNLKEKEFDVTFIGAKDPEREILCTLLNSQENFKFKVFGPGFNKFHNPSEFNDICNRSKIVLNISRGNYEGYTSLRLWNLMGTGAFVLTKYIPSMFDKLGIMTGTHLDDFKTHDELLYKINYYLNSEKLRTKIGLTGQEYVYKNRTWSNSVSDIIRYMRNVPSSKTR